MNHLGCARALARVYAFTLCLLMLLAGHPDGALAEQPQGGGRFAVAVVEHLRLKVPAEARQAWLDAERGSWQPWLERQPGYLGRELLWDGEREEGTLLIRWASRDLWKAIPRAEVEAVQERFEHLARQATGVRQGNPFPLVFEGELQPAA
jgi:uncharacterized protein (TIGR03792 family)